MGELVCEGEEEEGIIAANTHFHTDMLVKVPSQLSVNDAWEDLFEELQEMVEAESIEVLDEVDSQ